MGLFWKVFAIKITTVQYLIKLTVRNVFQAICWEFLSIFLPGVLVLFLLPGEILHSRYLVWLCCYRILMSHLKNSTVSPWCVSLGKKKIGMKDRHLCPNSEERAVQICCCPNVSNETPGMERTSYPTGVNCLVSAAVGGARFIYTRGRTDLQKQSLTEICTCGLVSPQRSCHCWCAGKCIGNFPLAKPAQFGPSWPHVPVSDAAVRNLRSHPTQSSFSVVIVPVS